MLIQLLRHLRNWFVVPGGVHYDTYTVKEGSITLPFLQEGQYFRIIGSVFNDGLYQYPAKDMKNETFSGAVWALAVPAEVVELSKEIEAWNEKHSASPFTSESFGGYSYTKAVNGKTGQAVTWQDVFRGRMNQWRRL